MLADAAIVRHLHLVVELGALADPGDAESGAVHAGIGPDFDVVPDRDAADMEAADLDIVRTARSAIAIPLAVKLSPYYSAMAHFASMLPADKTPCPPKPPTRSDGK